MRVNLPQNKVMEVRDDMKRKLPFIGPGQIIEELLLETGNTISRPTFYRKSYELNFPMGERSPKGGWRKYSRKEAEEIKKLIKREYRWSDLKKSQIN